MRDEAAATRPGRLEQLVYVSVGAVRVTSAMQMGDILAQSRPNNARDGVTGALTAVEGRFVQIIEGPADRIEGLIARLARDTRHREMTILDRRTVEARAFPRWDMVSPRLARAEIDGLAELLQTGGRMLDDYIAVFRRALATQDRLVAGAEGRATDRGVSPPTPADTVRTDAALDD